MAILDRKSPGQPDFFSSQVMSARRFFRPDAAEAAAAPAPPDCPEGTKESGGAGCAGAEAAEGTGVDKARGAKEVESAGGTGTKEAKEAEGAEKVGAEGTEETRGGIFRVISGGLERCVPGYEVRRESFPYWALEFVVSGTGSLTLNDRGFELKAGTLYAYRPGVSHRIAAEGPSVLEKYFVDLIPPRGISPQTERRYGLFAGEVIFTSSPETLARTFEEIIEYGRIPARGAGGICSALADLLLLKIAETAGKRDTRSSATSAAFAAYTRSRELMERRFLEFPKVESAAREANMDVSYLCRLFKRFGSFTPYAYLTRLRMNHAAGRLVRDGVSVKAAAAELGCSDEFTFSRRFKAVMGVSPGKFAAAYRRERPGN